MPYNKEIINQLLSEHIFPAQQLQHAYAAKSEHAQIDYFTDENNAIVLQWIVHQPIVKTFNIFRFENNFSVSICTHSNVEIRCSVSEEQDGKLLLCLLALTMRGVDLNEAIEKS